MSMPGICINAQLWRCLYIGSEWGGRSGRSWREMFVNQFAQLQGQLILHAVKNPLTLLLARQDAGSGQQGEVLGNIGLGRADRLHHLVDRARLVANGLQNPQAHGLAQQAEAEGNLLQLLFGQQIVGLSG